MCSNLISRFGRFLSAALACAPAALALVLIFAPGAVHGQNLDANFLLKFGTPGNAVGQFNDPRAVAVDSPSGKIVVADTLNNRTQIFDSSGGSPAVIRSFQRAAGGGGRPERPDRRHQLGEQPDPNIR